MAKLTVPNRQTRTPFTRGTYGVYEVAEDVYAGDYCWKQPDGRMAKTPAGVGDESGGWYTDRDMRAGDRRLFIQVSPEGRPSRGA